MNKSLCSICVLVSVLSLLTCTVQAEEDFIWAMKAHMQQSRSDSTSVVLNGQIYVIGGYVGGYTSTASVEEYDPVTDSWSYKAPISNPVSALRAATVNGKIYVFGGGMRYGSSPSFCISSVEYDPATNTWTPKSSMSEPKYRMGIGVFNDKIYIVGGTRLHAPPSGDHVPIDTVEEYDPLEDTWTTKTSMPDPPIHPNYSATVGSKIYIFGDPTIYALPIYVYDMATDSWCTKASPTIDVIGVPATAVMNDKIYTFGGSTNWANPIADVYEYDLQADTWSSKAPLITAVTHGPTASVINNKVYVLGGQTSSSAQSSTLVQEGTVPEPVIEALIDIDPDTLNMKSHGKWITVYITLPEGFDVGTIDISSIAITSLAGGEICDPEYIQGADLSFTPQVGDRDEDDILDLTVKFDRQVLLANLCLDDVSITIEGELATATGELFSGSDSIRIIDRGK